MPTQTSDAFFRFVRRHQSDLRRISRHTKGEQSVDEVQAEAWLMVHSLRDHGDAIDLDNPTDADRLIAHLYQHLVRYTEVNVRHAVRLDHAPAGTDGDAHPLARLLAADPRYDPMVTLMMNQEEALTVPTAHQSLAGAYLTLLERFGNRIANVARHLLISTSYCYRRCAHARLLAACQLSLPPESAATDTGFVPGAWRRFRVARVPEQLELDFELEEAMFEDQPVCPEPPHPNGGAL